MRRRDRDGPGAVVKLHIEKRRAHCRLAVRGKSHAAVFEKGFHPFAVMAERVMFDDGRRERNVFPQQAPFPVCDRVDRDLGDRSGDALVERAERRMSGLHRCRSCHVVDPKALDISYCKIAVRCKWR
ncbi:MULTISPECIES: hypothetical protein [unclassified Mesorhizobium]|uniref:hypothetical protein n=1 Tax=unclassified Mesorhizobium TaxID=325217 RepID=UPI001AEC9BA0|nr:MULTISPECIES: hypothetical protein [unclassified Mesorhizobium]